MCHAERVSGDGEIRSGYGWLLTQSRWDIKPGNNDWLSIIPTDYNEYFRLDIKIISHPTATEIHTLLMTEYDAIVLAYKLKHTCFKWPYITKTAYHSFCRLLLFLNPSVYQVTFYDVNMHTWHHDAQAFNAQAQGKARRPTSNKIMVTHVNIWYQTL